MLQALYELIKALPEILKLIQAVQKGIEEAQAERKVSQDIKTIHEAFNAKDADKLKALFVSQ